MGLNQFPSAIRQDETASAVEIHNLRDTPLELPTQRPMTETQRAWQSLHLVAWLLLLCIGGPILLHELVIHHFNTFTSHNGILEQSLLSCDAQGTWTSWSTLFEINLQTGNLSFVNAKIIDVAFNVVVGRGGQVCLAWIAYRVYKDVLIRIAEHGKIRYDLFAAISLCPNEIRTIGTTVASLSSTQNLRTKFMLAWTMPAVLYVLAYPTLISAATSLVGATATSIQLNNNETVPLDAYVDTAAYSFTDNGLDNEPDPWIVPVADITRIGTASNLCNIMVFSTHPYSGLDRNAITVNQTTYTLSNKTQASCWFYYGNFFYPVNMGITTSGGFLGTSCRDPNSTNHLVTQFALYVDRSDEAQSACPARKEDGHVESCTGLG